MATPLEKRIHRRINKCEENDNFHEHNGNINKAFGIPPRLGESVLMNTSEGKKLLLSAKIPKELFIKKNNEQINNRSDKINKFQNKSFRKLAEAQNSSNNDSNNDITNDMKEKHINGSSTLKSIESEDSDEFNSIFRSVSSDLEQLSRQMSESINNTYNSSINLTSPKFGSKKDKSTYSNKFSDLNVYIPEEDSYLFKESSLNTSDSKEYNKLSESSRKSRDYLNYLDNENDIRKNIIGISPEQAAIIDNLIRKLSTSINKLKNMITGKDRFVSVLREQMQKSNSEIMKLSQKVDFLQKELVSARKGKEKYKDSMRKLLNEMYQGKVDGTIQSYIMEIQAMKVQNEKTIKSLNSSEIALIQLQTEKDNLLEEKEKLSDKIIQFEEKIHKLNSVVNQVTEEKLQLLEMRDTANKEIEKLLENIKSSNDENKISLEELKRGYELNDVLQDHVMLLKAQLEIMTQEKKDQERIARDLKEETDIIKQNLKSLEHRESILLSALEDSSYRMTDIDKALEEQKSEYESLLKKENERYTDILSNFKKQSQELETIRQHLKEKTDEEKEQRKINEELQRKFGSFESHIRRLLDARDNEIMQLNDYMDGKLRKKEEETNQKIQEICKIQQEREKRLINQMLDQHDGFERKRMEYEHEINSIKNNFNEKLDKAVKIENEKQLRLAETLVNKEHELMIKENVIKEMDKRKIQVEQQLNEAKSCLNELAMEKSRTVEKLLSLEQWGILIQTVNQMNPELQDSLNMRLNELRNKVERLEREEDSLNDTINQQNIQSEVQNIMQTNEDLTLN